MFSPEHMHIFRFDMFNMHIAIPLLTIVSFLLNDSPVGKIDFLQKLQGTWFVTLYAVVELTLILTGVIPQEMIPYFFLDIRHMPLVSFLMYFVIIYVMAYLFSHLLWKYNKKLSWLWFKGVVRK